MSDASRGGTESEPSAWTMLRTTLRALGDERLGDSRRSFKQRAFGAALMSSISGGLAGFLPAFVAIGVAGLTAEGTPKGGVLGPLARALGGSPAWVSVLASLALVAVAVAVGFAASRTSAHFSSDVSAVLRVAMMRRVLATSPRALDAAGNALSLPRAPGAPPGAAPPGAAPPGARMQPGSDAVKLAVLRDGQMASELIVATLTNLPQALFGLFALVIDVTVSGSVTAALLGVGIFVLSRLFAGRASKNVALASAELSRADALAFSEVGEKVAHLDDLRLAGARDAALEEVKAAVEVTRDKRRAVARAVAISGQTSSLVATLAPLVVLLSFSLTGQHVSPPEVARLLLALPLIIGRLGAVDALRVATIEKRPVLSSVCRVLGLPEYPARSEKPVRLADLPALDIRFEHVAFTPPGGRKPILSDVSFTMPAGSVTALAGASGSGKSTILRLLLRLDEPTAGRILVGGTDLRDIEPDDLPALFGALAQGNKLLARTIEANVTLALGGREPAKAKGVALEALAQAQLGDLANDAGLARRFVAAPANLSGGEQRRVLLARALAQPARVLVLDEPEAGLPKATVRAMFEAVLAGKGERSVVVVTHAPGSLRAGQTVVLAAGKVVDIGTHSELSERCEVYRTITEAVAVETMES